ncbi:glycosyltransferase [Leeuwenhoekiella palythoae]|uniref:Glycosyl transferase family 1 n=1 Tax=Leeuwenhoekiella palythoae TaxID=573501 RepID=A0A1M5UDP0_9FLAO|nr:glycosyltransferase [Leeuwenhoekiella palythoae]RXG27153.1 glycosyl transferase family 1 [Leeuwenhoekiella palythoae]SHH61018.1 Glycosyl transferases group 1 [Leeuwenhoekiella palythoae]
MKVAFYIDTRGIEDVNFDDLDQSNPGIGGSEYALLFLLSHLVKNGQQDLEFLLFSNSIINLNFIEPTIVNDLNDSFELAINLQVNLLVLKHNSNLKECINKLKIPTIIWAHNFITFGMLQNYCKNEKISRIVNVSRGQLNTYRDHLAFNKSTYIYNAVNTSYFESGLNFFERSKIVTYVGSIVKAKGFHVLARIWKKVLIIHPNAELHVIGSGKLYNRSQKLGDYGIAEKSYEKEFIKFITDENGNLLKSIIFHGVLGKEKNVILEKTKVGVPNPSGNTETFGYTAIEMQGFGALITTRLSIGYVETVYKKKYLYQEENELETYLISALAQNSNEYENTSKYLKENFDIKIVSERWQNLFKKIKESEPNSVVPLEYSDNNYTKFKDFLRRIKTTLPFGYHILPSLLFFKSLKHKFKKKFL